MTPEYQPIADLLARVRSRWRRLEGLRALVRTALAASAVLVVSLSLGSMIDRAPIALAVAGSVGAGALIAVGVWALRPLRDVPSDRRVARFIEERTGGLDERLVSAVGARLSPDAAVSPDAAPAGLMSSMIADASRAASAVEPSAIVTTDSIRKAAIQAAAAVALCVGVAFLGRHTARRAVDAVSLALFPSRLILEVTPGDARVQAGSALTVEARLVGNQAPVVAQLLREEGGEGEGPEDGDSRPWRASEMTTDAANRFTLALTDVTKPFRYKVVAGPATSRTYSVAVVRPPRVTRIDVQYTYPKALGLPDRIEEDGGDVYAPEGTSVRLLVHTDRPAASGRMLLPGDRSIVLTGSGRMLHGAFELNEDTSYRLTLADAEGLTSRGDTEYFIRVLEDRPPEVRVVRPAGDRRVTLLEEVDIEAEAEDDFGIASLDLAYAIRGGAERIVPLRVSPRAASATGRHTLYLEDLDVRPGDFVSYYLRARDLARGKRSSEARSDIFFLEIKPFEEEFTLAQTQAAMGGGQSNQQLDDLVAAQKQIIVATWKLDRRTQAARGAKSDEDIRSVARAEGELKTRVEQAAGALRQLSMRDPRRPSGAGRGLPPGSAPRAGQIVPEEDAMSAAASAMAAAVASLEALKTAEAIPPEMEALNRLLKAQAAVKKRQIQQQAGGGPGGNRTTQDMSSLFDKELARQQQTNYEIPKTAQENDEKTSELDKISELARRQDELLNRQRELARNRDRMGADEIKRTLESLTREQNALRQRAEALAQQRARQQGGQPQERQPQGGQPQGGQQGSQQSQSGRQGQPGQGRSAQGEQSDASARHSSAAQGAEGATGQNRELREISEEMRGAASELRRQDAGQASARASRALNKLRELERELQARTPDGRRRALGDLQLEARQLADAEREIASAARRADGESGKDTLRRLAGEQQRLAERLRRVQEGIAQQGATGLRGTTPAGHATAAGRADGPRAPRSAADPGGSGGPGGDAATRLQQTARDVGRELERQRLGERMQQSADALRARAQPDASDASPARDRTAAAQEEIAQALDRAAERLSAADRTENADSRKLADQLSRAQELRDRLDDLTRQLGALDRPGAPSQSGRQGAEPEGRADSRTRSAGDRGRAGQGQNDSAGTGPGVDRLRAQAQRELDRIRELIRETDRDRGRQARGGAGITFEGQGMTLSAPGTEAFKQDFARWHELKRQAAAALEQVESALVKKLQEQDAKDRLTSGADDRAPALYQEHVDSYFKALATKKKPQ